MNTPESDRVRLQKVMAAAGIASRRASEEMIVQGRVRVNGVVVRELGTRVDPLVDAVSVNGEAVQLDVSKRYVIVNKPIGVVSSLRDEQGRPDLQQFVGDASERLFNVGRLDVDTSGLLLLTNDGDVAHALAHPSFEVTKTYVATVEGVVASRTIQSLLRGFDLDDGPIKADAARVVDRSQQTSIIEVSLHSGRNRIVRRMLHAVGHPVRALVRRQFGPLRLGDLPVGRKRDLTRMEVGQVLTIARNGAARKESPKWSRVD